MACFGFDEKSRVEKFDELWTDLQDHLIYVPFQVQRNGQVVYGQRSSFYHYKYYFEDVTKFTSETDCDEFIFSPSNIHLPSFIKAK